MMRVLHAELEAAILARYNSGDLDPGYGVHTNECGSVRYTVSDATWREILVRLLRLKLEVVAEESEPQRHEGTKR